MTAVVSHPITPKSQVDRMGHPGFIGIGAKIIA